MDKTTRGTNLIVSIRSVKHLMTNINKLHAQVTVFTFKKLGYNINGESSVVLIKNGVESLPSEAIVS